MDISSTDPDNYNNYYYYNYYVVLKNLNCAGNPRRHLEVLKSLQVSFVFNEIKIKLE